MNARTMAAIVATIIFMLATLDTWIALRFLEHHINPIYSDLWAPFRESMAALAGYGMLCWWNKRVSPALMQRMILGWSRN
jgi:hypothetical protein